MEASKRFVHLRQGNIYATTARAGGAGGALPALMTDLVVDTASGQVVDVWGGGDHHRGPSVPLPPADETREIDLEGKLVLPVPLPLLPPLLHTEVTVADAMGRACKTRISTSWSWARCCPTSTSRYASLARECVISLTALPDVCVCVCCRVEQEVRSMAELKAKLRDHVDAKRSAGELQPGRSVSGSHTPDVCGTITAS
jgi:hypothetical protein